MLATLMRVLDPNRFDLTVASLSGKGPRRGSDPAA